MAKRNRAVGSIRAELVTKATEATLAAIKVFNDPSVKFKSETFIVLMVIAWTYLLHAFYRSGRIEYRYFDQKGKNRKFHTTHSGAHKYWELGRCLDDKACPLDKDTINNLKFLIGLRNEIEHQMTLKLDNYLSGRYQACVLNFNHYLGTLFGKSSALDSCLTYSLQFVELSEEQIEGTRPEADIPQRLRAYVAEFDGKLSQTEIDSHRYSYRLIFTRKLAGRPGQADKAVEFIKPDSELAKEIDKQYWVIKDSEKEKFRAKDVVARVRAAGFPKFATQPHFINMWKDHDAKKPGAGYGTEVAGTWYWYESWVNKCIELCTAAGDKYR